MNDVKINLGYSLDLVVSEDDLPEVMTALLKAKKLDFREYRDGVYQQHTYGPPDMTIKPYGFTLEEAIQKAAVLDMPLSQYLENEGN
ncbi:hypothetical protein NVP1238A_58 [Vibrio phage 1.238.A._10N.261.52.F10]|uniref:Uncharacterized protein n=2 Tax=Pariacacavirus TaxID=2948856 RepID=A0A2I7RUI0_9CAUD|nr:hypothetical protein KNT79_gp58 [Vibrio phage 1.238.A._10N.261.52.F10]YP_010093504.1 hypothetical protein KNT80_gp61 [Vibrio phage 1.245.O._10N.261.54.C7]AUR97307.1 hypothetical protein NVP1238A_58 [Vibrio phage 1.238.A._10N.261.52.F10]AUR97401.1 hypothetical protein NVP1238B_59 [Vibrio phage 1.238.B._10N.261.52.F10]AUR97974.1 hypothetical protein NVP1245O_61 [Vibrio phage 1.245.O._10N.261.54.C7]